MIHSSERIAERAVHQDPVPSEACATNGRRQPIDFAAAVDADEAARGRRQTSAVTRRSFNIGTAETEVSADNERSKLLHGAKMDARQPAVHVVAVGGG